MDIHQMHFLVVDRHLTQHILLHQLKQVYSPANIHHAYTGEQALATLHLLDHVNRNQLIVLVDLDNHADHELYGLKLLQILKDEEHGETILAMSETDSPRFILSALKAGAVDFIMRPIGKETVRTLWLKTLFKSSKPSTRKEVLLKDEDLHMNTDMIAKRELSSSTEKWPHLSSPRLSQRNDATLHTETFVKLFCQENSPMVHIDYSFFPDAVYIDYQHLDKMIHSWNFDVYAYNQDELIIVSLYIFKQLDIFTHFNIDIDTFKKFLIVIRANYKKNPYHNFYHAVDVLQISYYMVKKTKAGALLKVMDTLGLAVAAYCHDVGHPGVNNFFMKNAKTPLSILYNDRSILENYHCSLTFALMRKHEFNFVASFNVEQFDEFRKSVISSILATDMALHFDYINRIETRLAGNELSAGSESDRLLLMAGIMKCADINNPARPFPVARRWALEISREYFAQGDVEKEMGYPIFVFGDRTKVEPCKSQADFIKYVVLPLYKLLGVIMPELQLCVTNLEKNLDKWERRMKKALSFESDFDSPVESDAEINVSSPGTATVATESGIKLKNSATGEDILKTTFQFKIHNVIQQEASTMVGGPPRRGSAPLISIHKPDLDRKDEKVVFTPIQNNNLLNISDQQNSKTNDAPSIREGHIEIFVNDDCFIHKRRRSLPERFYPASPQSSSSAA